MGAIRFCSTGDGVKIAFSETGRGPALVKTPNWMNHLELDSTSPIWRTWIETIGGRHRLVRYDARGCGLSDRMTAPSSFASNQRDLDAVVHAAGLERFALFGASQGAAIAIEYAARHPERVSHLIIQGGYLKGALKRDSGSKAEIEAQTMLKLVEIGWGRENSAFRQVFATQFIPDSTIEQLRAFDRIQQHTVSPEMAARLLATFYSIDVSSQAAQVRCPTLVMHARDDARVPFEAGRDVAAAIRGAEFVSLDSKNHILLDHQAAWHQAFAEIDAFFDRHGVPAEPILDLPATLTRSERAVLHLIASGSDNQQIARSLGITVKTVRNHINAIFGKLGVPNRGKAIVLAREAGLGRRQLGDAAS
jgi:pimeloyl-ACP methyl ester carboxylesterase/DNA-binding CsgD family transcriptional regulator